MHDTQPDNPRNEQPRRSKALIFAVAGLTMLLMLVALNLSLDFAPPHDEVERGAVWTDQVQRGPFVHSVRAAGALEPTALPETPVAEELLAGQLQAVLRVHTTQIDNVRVGQSASIDTRRGMLPGQVTHIGTAAEHGEVPVVVHLQVDQLPEGVGPGLAVDGTIEIEKINETLFVGRPAYARAFSTVKLFKVAADGTATQVPVELGRASVSKIEVLAGLEAGDQVILSDASQWHDLEQIYLR